MRLIYETLRSRSKLFWTAIFFLMVETFSNLLQPALMARIVEEGVKCRDSGAVLRIGGVMLLVALFGAVGAVLRNIFASYVSQQAGKDLRGRLYRHIQTYSFENIDRLHPSGLITRLTNDVTQIQNFINGCMRMLVKAPVTCVGAVFFIVAETPEQAPVMLSVLFVSSLLIAASMALGYPRFGRLQARMDRLNSVSREFLSSVRVVKAFGREDLEEERFGGAAGGLAEAGVSALRVTGVFGPLLNLTVNLGIVFVLWTGGVSSGSRVGSLMASVNYMTQVLHSLGLVTNILSAMVRAGASAKRVQEALDEKPALEEAPRAFPAVLSRAGGSGEGAVALEGVAFAYAGAGGNALEEVNFTAPGGEMVGIIGPTGSGKSTLLNLIPRFYDPQKGRVLVGGRDVRDISLSLLRKKIGVVPQRSLLFSGTIRENLLWGNPEAGEEELRRAAGAAQAEEFIQALPNGYDTVLGQGGVNLSGGQRQRLSIARALVRRPQILLLDDCTSALDANTEAAVFSGVRSLCEGATVILVSQRVSSVMGAGRILCMEEGRVLGQGNHRELRSGCALYREICRSQIGGEEDG